MKERCFMVQAIEATARRKFEGPAHARWQDVSSDATIDVPTFGAARKNALIAAKQRKQEAKEEAAFYRELDRLDDIDANDAPEADPEAQTRKRQAIKAAKRRERQHLKDDRGEYRTREEQRAAARKAAESDLPADLQVTGRDWEWCRLRQQGFSRNDIATRYDVDPLTVDAGIAKAQDWINLGWKLPDGIERIINDPDNPDKPARTYSKRGIAASSATVKAHVGLAETAAANTSTLAGAMFAIATMPTKEAMKEAPPRAAHVLDWQQRMASWQYEDNFTPCKPKRRKPVRRPATTQVMDELRPHSPTQGTTLNPKRDNRGGRDNRENQNNQNHQSGNPFL